MFRPNARELEKIEAQASAPDFWSDQEAAQKLLQQRSRVATEHSNGRKSSRPKSPTPVCSLNLPKKMKLR